MELLDLRWEDIGLVNRTIRVEQQLARSNDQAIKYAPQKTRSGSRTIELGFQAIEVLRAHYECQNQNLLEAGDKWMEHGLLFTIRYGGKIHYRNLLRNFKNLLIYTGLPMIRFHDLKHKAASLMLNNGVAPIIVSRRTGHARASITLDIYGHLIPSMQSEAAKMIDELITPVAIEMV